MPAIGFTLEIDGAPVDPELLDKVRQVEVSVSYKKEDFTEETYSIHTVRALRSEHYLPDRNAANEDVTP